MRRWSAALVAAVIAVVLAVVATTPPRPVGAGAAATAFSAERAMADVRAIARAPRPAGSAEHARVRELLVGRLRGLGMAVATRSSPIRASGVEALRRQGGAGAPPIVNVVGVLPGRDRALPALLLMAHYDSVVGSPGAADDAAGMAALLETVRALEAGGRARRDVLVLLTDGEELGLEGAAAFFGRDPLARRVGAVVNVEARGGGGRTSMFETREDNGDAMRLFAGAVRRPVATSLSVFVYRRLPNGTDLTEAVKEGRPGFNFAFIGRPGLYHSPLATPERLDRGALQDMGRQVLDLARALADAPRLPERAADLVFFDLFGLAFVHYAPVWGWLPLLAAAGLFAAAWRGDRQGAWRGAARGALAIAALVAVAGVLLWSGNRVSGAGAPTNYYDRLASIPLLQVEALLLCLGALAGVAGLVVGRQGDAPALWVGAGAVVLAAGAAAQIAAPTAAFPAAIALLAAGIAAAARARMAGGAGAAVAATAGGVGLGWLLALGYFLLQGVGGSSQLPALLPLALAAPVLLPLAPAVERRRPLAAAALLVTAGLAVALWVRLDPVAETVATYSAFKRGMR